MFGWYHEGARLMQVKMSEIEILSLGVRSPSGFFIYPDKPDLYDLEVKVDPDVDGRADVYQDKEKKRVVISIPPNSVSRLINSGNLYARASSVLEYINIMSIDDKGTFLVSKAFNSLGAKLIRQKIPRQSPGS